MTRDDVVNFFKEAAELFILHNRSENDKVVLEQLRVASMRAIDRGQSPHEVMVELVASIKKELSHRGIFEPPSSETVH